MRKISFVIPNEDDDVETITAKKKEKKSRIISARRISAGANCFMLDLEIIYEPSRREEFY